MNDMLILGGTGKTGSRIAQRLRDAGHTVRTASRTRGDVLFDLSKPSTWPPTLDGIIAAYLMEPNIQATEEGQRRIPRFVDAAVTAGVQRLVLLSAPGVEGNETHPLRRAEEAIKSSGLEWTIVRPTWFAQNFSEAFWLPGILEGALVLPTGDGATAFVDAEDIADIAQQLTGIYTAIRDGEAADVMDGVQRALGRRPRAFGDYVSAAATAGAWSGRR